MTVSVVTGASTGIGLATTVRLAAEGHTVFAGVRNPDAATELHAAVADGGLDAVSVVRLDVDDDASVTAAFAEVAAAAGPIDVLVNNAGISGSGAIEETPIDEFRRQMETNVFGLLRCTQAVVGSMRERQAGAIVNISSIAGRFVRAGMGAYAASKFAVEAVSDALAQELAPFGVQVVVIEPGVIATPIWMKSAPPPRETAYPLTGATTMRYFTRMLTDPTPAEAVADAIVAALTDDAPRLRHPVGWDAEIISAKRLQVTDEELVEMARLDADGWSAAFGERFFPLT